MTIDKAAFYKFKPEEEKVQGIVYPLIEDTICTLRSQKSSEAKKMLSLLPDTEE